MLLPTIKIKNQADLGKAVDKIMKLLETVESPRERRDLTFALATLSRTASMGLGVLSSSGQNEQAIEAVADAYVGIMAKEAAAALGYEMKDPIK